ncbi:MAG: ThuA domain-containing protein [Prosthecobacter sp.]|jgi:type 1 glutamine amidotransferase|nr:ThuA domain-containing protein [Prosthecobacter sp.]
MHQLSIAILISLLSLSHAADPLRVLIVDGQNNHKWEFTTPVLKHALAQSGAFEVTVTTTPPKGAPSTAWDAWRPVFRDYAVVVSNYNGEPWPEAVRADFEAYVQGGGGFVSVHAANNSFPEWQAYNEMIGVGGWGGRSEKSGPWLYVKDGKLFRDTRAGPGGAHGPQHEFVVEMQDLEHPITRGFPSRWLHCKDELYSRLRGPAQHIQILATAKSDLTGEQEPNLMVIQYGQGRVVHTTLGHADYSMLDRGFYEILERGTEWAATGKVELTAAIPADFPTEEKTSPVALEGHPKQAK